MQKSWDLENLKNTFNEFDIICTHIKNIQFFKSTWTFTKLKLLTKNEQEHYGAISKNY